MSFLLIIIILLFVGTAVFLWIGMAGSKVDPVKERLAKIFATKEEKATLQLKSYEEEQLERSFIQRLIMPVVDSLATKIFKKGGAVKSKLERQLIIAGNPGNLGPNEFKAIQMLIGVSLAAFFLFLGIVGRMQFALILAFTSIGAAAGFIFPKFWLGKKVTTRQKGIRKALPDVLDLLTVSVEAGLGFDMALAKVVEKMKGPLSDEFKKVLSETMMGRPRRESLKEMGARPEVEDLETFVNAIVQADQLGVAISNILRTQADQMRMKYRQRIEEQAMKAPLKMLFPMVLFIFPTIFIAILGPITLKIMEEFGGM